MSPPPPARRRRVRTRSLPALGLLAWAAIVAACGGGSPDRATAPTAVAARAVRLPSEPPSDVAASDAVAGGAELMAPAAAPARARLEGAVGEPPPPPPAAALQASADAPMLIRTGTASVEVDSVERAAARVRALAEQLGGYVASSSFQGGREQVRAAALEVKVPAARFDALVQGLAPLGRVDSVGVEAEDVGEEYADAGARLANARRLEARLVALVERRTARLVDVLAVERELARVREEVERVEGRMRYLRTHAAMSTLRVTVHAPPPLVGSSPVGNPIADATRQAWRNFVGFVAAAIAASGVLVPAAALAALAAWGWRRAARGRAAQAGRSIPSQSRAEPA